jgi:Fe(3+) dicitrate transport protein
VSFNQTDVLGKRAIDTSKDSELMVKLGFHDEDSQSDAIGLTRGMYEENPRRATIAPNDRMFLRRYDLSITHEQRFSANTKLRTLLYAYRLDRTWRRQDWTRTPVPGEDYERVVGDLNLPNDAVYFKNTNTVLDRSYETAGVEPRFEHRFTTGAVSHTLDLGGRLLLEGASYTQGAGTNPTTYAGSSDYKEHHVATAGAAYVQDRIAFRDDLLVTPGVRFEAAHYSRTIDRQNTGTGPKDVSITGEVNPWAFIPGIGITYGSKALNVFGGEHIGWAPPRLTSAVSPRGTPAQTSSEFSTNFEAGARTAPWKWLRAEATGFVTLYKNQVISTSGGAGAQSELADGGPTNIAGVESMLALGLGTLFHWATIVDVGARYTYSRATFSAGQYDGNILPYAPLHSFNANLDIEHPSGFGGQVAYNFVSDQFTDQANTRQADATGNLGLIPARNVVDFTAHYKHKPTGLSFRFTVKNLTDEVYIWARRPNGIFASGFRQFVLGLKWEFDGPTAN